MKIRKNNHSFEEIKAVISYDPITGIFAKKRNKREVLAASHGYLTTGIGGKSYQLQRLAWLLVNGVWPNGEIDHINGDKKDNRISNLRLCSRSQNCANKKKLSTNSSGFKGVHWHKRDQKFYAQIKQNGRVKHIGTFDSDIEAAAAYDDAAIKIFGDFSKTNVSYV